jgi:hypothetical protein
VLTREFVDMARFGQWVDGSASAQALGLGPVPPLPDILRQAIAWYVRHRYITLPGRGPLPGRDPPVSVGDEA